MARARNRVGIEADDSGDVGLQDDAVTCQADDNRVSAVDANETLLEEKRLKKQKELLQKKKAERRAHAKQRKQTQLHEVPEGKAQGHTAIAPLLDVGDQDGMAQDQRQKGGQIDPVEVPADTKTEEPAPAVTHVEKEVREVEVEADAEDAAISDESLPNQAGNLFASVEPNNLSFRLPVEVTRDKPTAQSATPSDEDVSGSPTLSKDIHEDTRTPSPEELPHSTATEQPQSASSLVSETATLSVDETEALPQHEIRRKRTKKPSPSPQKVLDSSHEAARTIQKAMKKRILHQTKKTFQKAKSLIRSSSRILVEETTAAAVDVPVKRPLIVPPLALKPRPPLPSSPSSSEDEDDCSSASSSTGSFTNHTHSRPSSCSSCSSDCSSSESSQSASSTRSSPQRRKRSKPRKQVDGPSAELLLPPMPKRSSGDSDPRHFGELHHYMATKIQARVRGMLGRSIAAQREAKLEEEIRAEALLEIEQEASVRIQAHVKGFLERRRLGISNETVVNPSKPRKAHHHSHPHTKHNSVMPQCMAGACGGVVQPEDAAENDAEWPDEFNLEPLDDWDELNRVATPKGETVSAARFLSRGKVRVFCGTWNLHAKKPKDDLRLWIPSNRYHVVAVGTEECVNSIAKSVVFTSKKQWEDQLKETLGDEYVLVAAHSLTAIHNAVFVHESVLPYVQNIQSDAVATGLGNQLGNKGGVGVAFSIGHTSFAFVNCHFDAHQHNVAKRNANFHRINQELQLTPMKTQPVLQGTLTAPQGLGRSTTSRFSSSAPSPMVNSAAGSGAAAAGSFRRRKLPVSESFDRVFWFGDLNYRINGTRRMIDLLLLHNHHAVLRFNDQLRIEMHKGNVFGHFQEGPLHFRPTYKFDKHSNVYDSGPKQRIPSWTDRILYLSNEKSQDIELLSYRSHMNFQSSDHRPVGAAFRVSFHRGLTTENEPVGPQREGSAIAGDQEFARVLAKGYKPNQTRSEVCVVQ